MLQHKKEIMEARNSLKSITDISRVSFENWASDLGITAIKLDQKMIYNDNWNYPDIGILKIYVQIGEGAENLISYDDYDNYEDYGATEGDFWELDETIEQIKKLEPTNSVQFIKEDESKNKYALISFDQVKDLKLGRLALYFLEKEKIDELKEFIKVLLGTPHTLLPEYWFDRD